MHTHSFEPYCFEKEEPIVEKLATYGKVSYVELLDTFGKENGWMCKIGEYYGLSTFYGWFFTDVADGIVYGIYNIESHVLSKPHSVRDRTVVIPRCFEEFKNLQVEWSVGCENTNKDFSIAKFSKWLKSKLVARGEEDHSKDYIIYSSDDKGRDSLSI